MVLWDTSPLYSWSAGFPNKGALPGPTAHLLIYWPILWRAVKAWTLQQFLIKLFWLTCFPCHLFWTKTWKDKKYIKFKKQKWPLVAGVRGTYRIAVEGVPWFKKIVWSLMSTILNFVLGIIYNNGKGMPTSLKWSHDIIYLKTQDSGYQAIDNK